MKTSQNNNDAANDKNSLLNSRNIKLIVAYDGTDFSGWQCQSHTNSIKKYFYGRQFFFDETRTVQGELENALEKMHGKPIHVTGSGRTDAGVHAAGQGANFYTNLLTIAPNSFIPALNRLLPQDIRILDSVETPHNFHARFSAICRTYRYYFICCRAALPHESRYNLQLWRYPQIEILNSYGRLLLGETDCSVFAASSDTSKSKSRYLYKANFFMESDRLVFEISANAFLRKMVRSVTGTFLYHEEKQTSIKKMKEIIESGRRGLAGPTLPPHGLFLWNVDYGIADK